MTYVPGPILESQLIRAAKNMTEVIYKAIDLAIPQHMVIVHIVVSDEVSIMRIR